MTQPVIVIAPHPDDELLGAGGIMARANEAGAAIVVIVLTDGGASDPALDPAELSRRRRAETIAGLDRLLGGAPELTFLGYPDGGFDARHPSIADMSPLRTLIAKFPSALVVVTDPADNHPDHKAAFGFASRLAEAGLIGQLAVVPVSQRVDGVFDPIDFEAHDVGGYAKRKAEALSCHSSQIETHSGFVLSAALLTDFCGTEYVRHVHDRDHAASEPVVAEHFESMFRTASDPWGYDTDAYEADRFDRTVAALDDRRFAAALELGCGNGALTQRLVAYCDTIVATDVSHAALTAAVRRLENNAAVTFTQGCLPADVPDGDFDLIMLSDMLYYLGLIGVAQLMTVLNSRALPNCRIVMTNYLGKTECSLSGEMAAEIALAHLPGWTRVMRSRTDRLRLDVLERA